MIALAVAALVLLPILTILWAALRPAEGGFAFLASPVMGRYLLNTLVLVTIVGALAGLIGTTTAFLISRFEFPGRRVLEYALMAPLAVPSYIAAYAVVDFLDYAGPLQTALRSAFGWTSAQDYWFPEVRSLLFGACVMAVTLYPYVYLFAKSAFDAQSGHIENASRALGVSPFATALRITLPLARPAIFAGIAIVMMEVVNDFGTVDFFAIQTLTTGIFSQWLEAGNPSAAAQIASAMMCLVFLIVLFERIQRRNRKFFASSQRAIAHTRAPIPSALKWVATLVCLAPFVIGFVGPVTILCVLATGQSWADADILAAFTNTLLLGAGAAVAAIAGAVLVTQAVRYSRGRWISRISAITTIGYALPGAILALGIVLPLAAFDHLLADTISGITGAQTGLMLSGSAFVLVLAYVIRFFAIPQNAAESALTKITPSIDMSARALGRSRISVLTSIHLPLMRGSLLTAGILVFVDTVKELPATLMLRPFNFETLATLTYNRASLEDIAGAAPSAILVMIAGIVPVLLVLLNASKTR